MMMAWLEKHFRIGKRTFNGLWGKLNDNFISTCGYAILLLVVYEVWALLTSALLFFVSRIGITAVAYSLSGGVFIIMHVVLLYVIGCIYLWLPCMQITGFRAMEALHYSYQLYAPVKGKVLLAQFLTPAFLGSVDCSLCYLRAEFFGVYVDYNRFIFDYNHCILCSDADCVFRP